MDAGRNNAFTETDRKRESVCNTAYRALSYEYAVGWWVVGFNNTSEVRRSYSRI